VVYWSEFLATFQRSGFDSRHYQNFWEVVGLERGPFSLVSTTEELLERKSSGSGLESREHGRRDPSRWPQGSLYPQKLPLTSPTSGCRSAGIVFSRTQATEFRFSFSCVSVLLPPYGTGEGRQVIRLVYKTNLMENTWRWYFCWTCIAAPRKCCWQLQTDCRQLMLHMFNT
jgi:hypothetical protein